MRKILTLLISVTMIISMMSAIVFATPSYEAELLSDLSIMQGDPDGNMRYEDKVSRAECAKIIVATSKYRDMIDLNSKRSAFKDVTADHWAAPFVAVGVKNGLFKGYLDATFRPSNTITYEEAITMLVHVLDYTEEDMGNDWPYDQIEMAKKLGMLDGVTKSIGQALTRRDISRLVYNTLNAKAKGAQVAYLSTFERTVGPITVTSSEWYRELGADADVKVMRDGAESSVSEVKNNDIAYYMVEYNKVLVYSKKVTGIYESASPNKDTPTSVTVSGVTYNIEGDNAYSKLSSGGEFNYGDTVTLLLGKSGDVAGVASKITDETKVTGFLSAIGTKDTVVSGTTVTKPYVKVVLPSGEVCEYTTEKDYSSLLNRAVTVKLNDGLATVSLIAQNNAISGQVVWDSGIGRLGTYTLSSDISIIEVSTTDSKKTATVASVYPQRLNGLKLFPEDILYISINSVGNITEMILNDVTGDSYTYGIITSAKNSTDDRQIAGSYKYIVDGVESSLNTSGKTFGVSAGQAVQIVGNGRDISSMMPLTQIKTQIKGVNGSMITLNDTEYIMSDKVQIYVKNSQYRDVYNLITIDELTELADKYNAFVYTDRDIASGGRVRIIVLRDN